ncbi:hypothetical protein TRICI_005592 [Trichomonascus ciferrii]|uniref:Dolichol-phosphate mannosyltransferase subunit 3 n=1 Tax=Trichomonascus ciferrii TaxID=44093 RepID=A0A642USB2_9ASCO|nr:hypothetical protein TRICI_005592 [Trichomonascus ciferrii]
MTKATETAQFLGVATLIYLALYVGLIPTNQVFRDEVLPVFPFWCLVAFGSFALGTLGYDVLTFNDKEDKYRELLKAKDELRSKGVEVDD